ncbi:MAG: hypothetical protein JSR83_21065 [Proteobacteria bacterium]|nr:hypothetical protein [Pseudomonadota bacterium]
MLQALTQFAHAPVDQLQTLHHLQADLIRKFIVPTVGTDGHPVPAFVLGNHAEHIRQALGGVALRQLRNLQSVLPAAVKLSQDVGVYYDLFAFQRAFLERLSGLQTQWLEGLESIAQEAGEIRQVNTASKLIAQEYNLYAQFSELLMGQVSAVAELVENAQIDFGYLITRTTEEN